MELAFTVLAWSAGITIPIVGLIFTSWLSSSKALLDEKAKTERRLH